MSTRRAVPRRRRQKTQLACNPCRARKTGCDGRRPVCTSCSMKGLGNQCNYQEKYLTLPNLALPDVNERLQSLEEKVRGYPLLLWNSAGVTATSDNAHPGILEPGTVYHSHDVEEESVYGPSSNVSFLRQVAEVRDTEVDATQTAPSTARPKERITADLLGFSIIQSPRLTVDTDLVSLPERQLADRLLRCFWDLIHPIFPILHWPSFTNSYDRLWQLAISLSHYEHTTNDIVLYAISNMVLALGCQRSEDIPAAKRMQLADSFYRRSYRLISIETLDFSSLEVVQLFLLRAIYLHYTTHADRCWNTVGVALRVAQALGLHLERTDLSKSQLKQELRHRVWHNCIALDRLSATTFGRPVLYCGQHAVPLPKPIDDEYLLEVNEGCQPVDTPSRIDFFIHTLKLFELLNEILSKFYSHHQQNPKRDELVVPSQCLGDLLMLCSKLDEFLEGLPGHLKVDSDGRAGDEPASCFRMQAKILQSRVLYIRLLLLRPSLLAEARRCASNLPSISNGAIFSLLQRTYLSEINRLCVSTAYDVLEEMHQSLSTLQRTSAWHTLFFTFGATSTLLAASLCPDLEVNLDIDPAKTSWERSLQIFEFHKSHVESAGKGIEALKRYRHQFSALAKKDLRDISNNDGVVDSMLFDTTSVVDESWQTSMAEDFNEFFTSDSLDQSWLSSQCIDWGMH